MALKSKVIISKVIINKVIISKVIISKVIMSIIVVSLFIKYHFMLFTNEIDNSRKISQLLIRDKAGLALLNIIRP
jgi:hypothetical protein